MKVIRITLSKRQQNDKWKSRFIILCFINLSIICIITIIVFLPIPKTDIHIHNNDQIAENSSHFFVQTTKQNVNNIVNAYLEKLLAHSNHQYSIILGEDVQLLGELPFFSTTVPLLIHLDPYVLENGDVILKQKSISIGRLQVSNKKVLHYVATYLPVPEWVIINANKEEIYVEVTNIDTQSNLKISVEQFDLEANNISFKISVPYESIGIDVLPEDM